MTPRELVENFYSAFDRNQPALLADTLALDWKAIPPVPGNPGGLSGQQQTIGMLHTVFGDFSYTPVEIIEAGDTIVARALLKGRHIGTFLGVPATQREIVMQTIEIHRIVNGRIAETHHIEDFFGAYMQMTAS
jgi:predicted ester cyclase